MQLPLLQGAVLTVGSLVCPNSYQIVGTAYNHTQETVMNLPDRTTGALVGGFILLFIIPPLGVLMIGYALCAIMLQGFFEWITGTKRPPSH